MYLEIDEGYFEHPKTLDLCARMQNHEADVYPIRLWKWACRSAKSGRLGKVGAFVVEKAAGYIPMDGRLFGAMCSVRFLDVDGEGNVEIHDWMRYTGGAIKRMDGAAVGKKLWRAHKDGKCGHGCDWCRKEKGQSSDSPRTLNGRGTDETAQDKTSPDQSRQDKSSQEEISPPALAIPGVGTTECDVKVTETPDAPVRPTNAYRLVHCLRREVEKRRPTLGPWNPGMFADKTAREFLEGFGERVAEAIETIEKRIVLFAEDPTMDPWTVDKFVREYNRIGQQKALARGYSAPAQKQVKLPPPVTMADVEAKRRREELERPARIAEFRRRQAEEREGQQ